MQKLWTGLSIVVLSLISIGALAQGPKKSQHRFPRWVSDKGYWVIETNLSSPLDHRVSFYNNDNTLLYSKSITGVRLNPDRKRVKMKLKKELESAVIAWEKNKVLPNRDELSRNNSLP